MARWIVATRISLIACIAVAMLVPGCGDDGFALDETCGNPDTGNLEAGPVPLLISPHILPLQSYEGRPFGYQYTEVYLPANSTTLFDLENSTIIRSTADVAIEGSIVVDSSEAQNLEYAVLQRDYDCALRLLGAGADPNKSDVFQATPLGIAVCGGDSRMCELLLSYGADVNSRGPKPGYTPMHIAAGMRDRNAMQWLLDIGADPFLLDDRRRSALHCAIAGADVYGGGSPVSRAFAKYDRAAMVRFLVKLGLPVDCKDSMGRTPLHLAVIMGAAHACSCLLNAGAYVNELDARGRSPLWYGRKNRHLALRYRLTMAGGMVLPVEEEGIME